MKTTRHAKAKRLCRTCGEHHAIFFVHGDHHPHCDPDHDLCPRCFRSVRDHLRAVLSTAMPIASAG